MFSGTFFGLIATLYYLSFLLLAGLTLFIAWRGSSRTAARSRLRWAFFLLALSLLLWQSTLFLEGRAVSPGLQLWLGRINFTAIVFTVSLALRFVREVAGGRAVRAARWFLWLRLETWGLAALTLLTPLVDAAERVEIDQPITTYGVLFPLYLLHVVGCLGAALLVALWKRRRATHRALRGQLTVIAVGIVATGSIACVTNALLPYVYGDFRFCDLGPLATIFFLLAVCYATFIHRLFSIRVLVRVTLVYGILLAFVLGTYSSALFILTKHLTDHTEKFIQFTVLVIAFSLDPFRRALEKRVDRFLFDPERQQSDRPKQEPAKMHFTLALLFPWGRH